MTFSCFVVNEINNRGTRRATVAGAVGLKDNALS